jgi:aminoglycoside phosphotransferase (APT) family kinase protein
MEKRLMDLDGIPPERREAVRAALASCTRGHDVGPITLLKGGVSGALIYRVDTGRRSLALRIEPERIALEHRRRGFACMEAAAAIDVAPRVFFADPAAGIAVMDFIDAKPIATHPGGRAGVARELGALVGRIQTTTPFPRMLGGDEDMIASVLQSLEMSGLFAAGLLERHRDELARIRAAVPWDPLSLVSSHNDPNPRNLLFDGVRLWLVDWEMGSRNDRLFDLAIATTEIANTPDLEAALLTAALGRPPDATLRARLRVVRQLTRLFYGCIVLDAVMAGRSKREDSLDALSPAQFQAAAAQGRLAPGEIGYAFGKMSLAAFIDGCSTREFEESLALATLA